MSECFKVWFDEIPGGLIAYRADLQGVDEYRLAGGEFIDDWPSDVTLHVKGREPQDYLFCTLTGWLPVSRRVQVAFETCGVHGVQFLPVRVVHDSGVELRSYALLNVLNVVAALDREHTVWLTKERDQVQYPQLNILKAALRRSAIVGADIFRLRERDVQVYVSNRLKECLEQAGVTVGFRFIPVPAY